MEKLEYCYHCHTYRCGHALGTDEDYVKAAIKAGIKRLGFSDHVMLPGVIQKTVRGDYSQLDEYISSIKSLKEKYKDLIDIIVGFEAEYLPEFEDYYRNLLETKKVDFLIQGQHFQRIDGKFYGFFNPEEYVSLVERGIDTGLFSYLAHPDLFIEAFRGWNESLIPYVRRILKKCEETNTPIEINVWGHRNHRMYPCEEFFKLASEYNVKVVIGVDAHVPDIFLEKE